MNPWRSPEPHGWRASLEAALAEDLGSGDPTAPLLAGTTVAWFVEAQQSGVVCGLGIAQAALMDSGQVGGSCKDGDAVEPGAVLLEGRGDAAMVFSRERVALNFLGFLSGIATEAKRYVDAVEGTGVRIVDTRKTVPGLRNLSKYAVRCGEAQNHRLGLFDAPMLKDNHLKASDSIQDAIARTRSNTPHTARIVVECESAEQVDQAVEAGADVVLLDNMSPQQMRRTVERHSGRAIFEASGGITLQTVREVALTGVDVISVGAITHSAPAFKLHLEVR